MSRVKSKSVCKNPHTGPYYKFIAISSDGVYGKFGYGYTAEEAAKNLKKAGGRAKGAKIVRFKSDLPFVEIGLADEAKLNQSDAWIGQDGSINWIRCDREWLDIDEGK